MLAAALEDRAEIAPVDQFHRDVVAVADLSFLQHPDDVRMAEELRDVRFRQEHLHRLRVLRHLSREPLDRYRLSHALALPDRGAEDFAHAPPPDAGLDVEAAEWKRRDWIGVGHFPASGLGIGWLVWGAAAAQGARTRGPR